jgi:hypothetical protein
MVNVVGEVLAKTTLLRINSTKIFDCNELVYMDSIFCIKGKASSHKLPFNTIKVYRNTDYTEGNTDMAWETLKNKYESALIP